jgi:hypothetical protein
MTEAQKEQERLKKLKAMEENKKKEEEKVVISDPRVAGIVNELFGGDK